MLEWSSPESLKAEIAYRQQRARELARSTRSGKPERSWLSRLRKHSDLPDSEVGRRAA